MAAHRSLGNKRASVVDLSYRVGGVFAGIGNVRPDVKNINPLAVDDHETIRSTFGPPP